MKITPPLVKSVFLFLLLFKVSHATDAIDYYEIKIKGGLYYIGGSPYSSIEEVEKKWPIYAFRDEVGLFLNKHECSSETDLKEALLWAKEAKFFTIRTGVYGEKSDAGCR